MIALLKQVLVSHKIIQMRINSGQVAAFFKTTSCGCSLVANKSLARERGWYCRQEFR